MKIRIKFKKQGMMKFIGHLDIMRYFQKAIKRAGLDIAYTEGFSPHMIMSFAAPLGVGLTSEGEYFDIEMNSSIPSAEALERLNEVMVEGMEVTSFRQVEEGKKNNAMALVAAADYSLEFRPGTEPQGNWQEKLQSFFEQEQILIVKKTKKSEKEVDIKPMIYDLHTEENEIRMQLSTGSASNLKPELVMEAFAAYAGFDLEEHGLLVNRVELYADRSTDGGRKLVSLEDLGEDIV